METNVYILTSLQPSLWSEPNFLNSCSSHLFTRWRSDPSDFLCDLNQNFWTHATSVFWYDHAGWSNDVSQQVLSYPSRIDSFLRVIRSNISIYSKISILVHDIVLLCTHIKKMLLSVITSNLSIRTDTSILPKEKIRCLYILRQYQKFLWDQVQAFQVFWIFDSCTRKGPTSEHALIASEIPLRSGPSFPSSPWCRSMHKKRSDFRTCFQSITNFYKIRSKLCVRVQTSIFRCIMISSSLLMQKATSL